MRNNQSAQSMRKKVLKIFLWALIVGFLLLNFIAYRHAYKFTHFSTSAQTKTKEKLKTSDKVRLLFTGVNNPRPVNKHLSQQPYQTVRIQSNRLLEGWLFEK